MVTQTLLHAATSLRKRFSVYCTEARPYGQGIKTHDILTRAGIPCTLVLDSAAAVAMSRCTLVMVGAEGVAESGGVINAVGSVNDFLPVSAGCNELICKMHRSWSLALAAKAYNKPVYALAESFKFLRLFPLSQFDLPTPKPILQFAEPENDQLTNTTTWTPSLSFDDVPHIVSADEKESDEGPGPLSNDHLGAHIPTPSRLMKGCQHPSSLGLSLEQIDNNPLLDYTLPDYIRAIISDVGVLTPSVSVLIMYPSCWYA